MTPYIESGQRVTVSPLRDVELQVGDIVLCTVKGRDYLHFIGAIDGDRYMIQNARKRQNGWTRQVWGLLMS